MANSWLTNAFKAFVIRLHYLYYQKINAITKDYAQYVTKYEDFRAI